MSERTTEMEMNERDPQVGDSVLVSGVIKNIVEGVATVKVYRSWPLGVTVPVQCGALEHDERAANADGGVPGVG